MEITSVLGEEESYTRRRPRVRPACSVVPALCKAITLELLHDGRLN